MLVILDTDEIVKRYAQYDPLFNFCSDGVKDVIKMAVLDSGRQKPSYMDDRETEVYWMRSLAGRLVREWEHAIDQELDRTPTPTRTEYSLANFRNERDVVQLVVEQIEEDIDRLIQSYTGERTYRVRQIPKYARSAEWLLNDLVVTIGPEPEV